MKHYLTRHYYAKGHNTLSAETFREDPHKQGDNGSLLNPVVKFNHIDMEEAYRNVDLLVTNGIDLPHNEDVFSWFVYFLRYVSFTNLYVSEDGTKYDTSQTTDVSNPMCQGPAKGAWVIKLEKTQSTLFDMLCTGQYDKEAAKTAKVKPTNVRHLLKIVKVKPSNIRYLLKSKTLM